MTERRGTLRSPSGLSSPLGRHDFMTGGVSNPATRASIGLPVSQSDSYENLAVKGLPHVEHAATGAALNP
jgi:hypothetical protein